MSDNKIFINVHSRGHYPSKTYLVTSEQYLILIKSERSYGYLSADPDYDSVISPILTKENEVKCVEICLYE